MVEHRLEILLAAVAKKDRAAFKALYDATSAKLFAIAFRILKRSDLAEEVLQDVYLKIWLRAPEYLAKSGEPMTWMGTIVRNRSIDVLRKRVERVLSTKEDAMAFADETPDPFDMAVQSEALHALLSCMEELDPDHRKCLLLAYYHGFTHEEIAHQFSIPTGTVKSRIRRALARIRECMSYGE